MGEVHCKVCNCLCQSLFKCDVSLCASSDISVSLSVIQWWRRNSSAERINNTFVSLLPPMFPTTESCCRCFIPFAVLFLLFFHFLFRSVFLPEQMWFCPTAHVPSHLWFFFLLPLPLFYSVRSLCSRFFSLHPFRASFQCCLSADRWAKNWQKAPIVCSQAVGFIMAALFGVQVTELISNQTFSGPFSTCISRIFLL